MQLTSLFLAAAAVLTVSAAPEMAGHRCHGDMEFDPIQKQCKCDRGEYYDAEFKSCRIKEVKTIKAKSCAQGEQLFCARSEGDYVPYNKHSKYCLDDKHSKLICAKRSRVSEVFKHEVRKDYELTHVNVEEQEQKRVSCHAPRAYNHETKACECPKNKIWKGNDCGFPALHKPKCHKQEKAFCAKSSRQIVAYSKTEKTCEDNGKNYVFCCGGSKKSAKKASKAKFESKYEAKYEKEEEVEVKAEEARSCLAGHAEHLFA